MSKMAYNYYLLVRNGQILFRTFSVFRMYSNSSKCGVTCKGLHRLSLQPQFHQIFRNYAFKSDLKIKWVRPPKIPCIKPEKSGDLALLPAVDKNQYPLEFQNSEELKTADKLVRRVFSLEFFPRQHSMKILRIEMINSVKRHALDRGSSESKIAQMTADIRNLQQVMEEFPRDKRCKVQLKELIDRRKKWLKFLRKWDYKRFEWLLEKLDLVYKPAPSEFHWITRKDSLRKLTDKHCAEVRQQRLDAYRASLEGQQVDFLQEKAKKLQWIRNEEQECGVEPTVSEADIENVLKQLKELELSREQTLKDEVKLSVL